MELQITYYRMKITIIAAMLVILILFGIKLDLELSLSEQGPTLAALKSRIIQMHYQNMELQDQLLSDESFTTIAQEAYRMGFVPAQIIYLP